MFLIITKCKRMKLLSDLSQQLLLISTIIGVGISLKNVKYRHLLVRPGHKKYGFYIVFELSSRC